MTQFHTPREWLEYGGGIFGFQNDWEELLTFGEQDMEQPNTLKNCPTPNNKNTSTEKHWCESHCNPYPIFPASLVATVPSSDQ